ncbi:uncharacterized protein LOC127711415 [Mytilus californianus]|uniref:uncharacterized protein LOC127711415 n=1 Tax=Mytilus californianus TaxID=6549 RepID=UPI0022455003|nr:uncharacterized protein LOC127711415 [Mytilus californianus]XP_052073416.1 uncharacterized protein LOC127711415 [Mytilus californianus]
MRNIWNTELYMKRYANTLIQPFYCWGDNYNSYSHVTSTVCLPNYCLSSVFTNRDVDNSYVSSLLGLSVFATAIDSMIPASYIEPKRYSTLKGRVKHILQKRFPVGTKVCFDIAMPYVYWARGELKLATDHFLALVQTERRGRIKALYLNELARMHAQVGEGDQAARFYRMASDEAQEKFRDCTAADQISGQTQMLLANLNDQGILNEEKARKSKSCWNSIISSPYFHEEGSERASIEAMLCFHGNWWTGENLSWLQVAADCLKELVKSYPDLHYHLACVYGFMGSFIEAEAYIKMSDYHLPYCNTIPNDIKISAAMRNWGCLTSFNTRAIPHLKIMWRTQLCHPSYVSESKYGMEVDFCPRNLNFRLNQEGCVTGDMQMCLPPIRAVCLNPYTGCLTFNSIPGKTESWICDEGNFYIPTLCELYRDEDGITVHMKQQSFSCFESYYRKNTNKCITRHSMVFNWKNGEGLTEKFNLFSKIQDVMYKETKKEILQKVILDKDNPQQNKQDALKYLDFAYKHGRSITINECMQHVAFLRGKSIQEYYQITSGFKPKHQLSIYRGPVIYGKCLLFLIRYGTDPKDTIRVIIRCADRESFKRPMIHKLYLGRVSIEESYKTVGAKLAWCAEHGQQGQIILFNQYGEIHEQFPLRSIIDKKQSEKEDSCCIMGENFVYIDKNDRMCIRLEHENTIIANLNNVKEIFVVNADVCVVQESMGVCVFNIRKTTCLKLNLKIKESIERDILVRDEYVIHLAHNISIHLLETKIIKTDESIIYRIVLHAETLLLVIEISEQQSNQFYEASITTAIHLPGYPTDFCSVSRNAGFLVSWRHDKEISHKYSRQHLFHFSTEGQLLGTIPFLGDSPFSFFPVFLDGDPNILEKYPGYGTPGWYVYMRDGHGGILCVKLLDFY